MYTYISTTRFTFARCVKFLWATISDTRFVADNNLGWLIAWRSRSPILSPKLLGILLPSHLTIFLFTFPVTWRNSKWILLLTWDILGRSNVVICVLYRLKFIYMWHCMAYFTINKRRAASNLFSNASYDRCLRLRPHRPQNVHCSCVAVVPHSVASQCCWCWCIATSTTSGDANVMVLPKWSQVARVQVACEFTLKRKTENYHEPLWFENDAKWLAKLLDSR